MGPSHASCLLAGLVLRGSRHLYGFSGMRRADGSRRGGARHHLATPGSFRVLGRRDRWRKIYRLLHRCGISDRSCRRMSIPSFLLVFFFSFLLSGMWPYLRNLLWTRNPVFPFLSARLSPSLVIAYALRDLASDTGASSAHDPLQFVPFLFLAAAQENNAGLWDFFGPTVLALAPLVLLASKKRKSLENSHIGVVLVEPGNFLCSGLPRFLPHCVFLRCRRI